MKHKILILLLVTGFILSMGVLVGSASLSFWDVLEIFAHKLWGTETSASSAEITIVWNIRLPRVILSFLVGGALAVSGTVAQSILQNPLASPYTLGVSSGASFGAAVVILYGLHFSLFPALSQIFFAFLFGVGTIFLVLGMSYKVDHTLSNTSVVLTGMVVSLFFSGLLTTLLALSSQDANKMIQWSMGSFALRGWAYIKLLLPFLSLGLLHSLWIAKELDLFSFGEKEAQSMGMNSTKVKIFAFFNMAMMTGACIAITGTIGFVDLIAPHISRKWVGNRHIALIPTSFFIGGSFMTATDTVARSIISPSELPVGAVTALLGAPFFFVVYQGRKGK
ncbi:MAG: iron ABC transporter permease [Eubacteriales bacterium]